jgi:hypothetical protein
MVVSVMIVGRISVDGGPPRPATMTGTADTLGTWGGVPPEYVDIGPPGPQPQPPWYPGHPAHPIPPVVWPQPPGGAQPPWYPGHPAHPIPPVVGGGPIYPPESPPLPPPWWPGHPAHPIPPIVGGGPVFPPGTTPPWWPGAPTHPIPPTVWPQPPTGESPPASSSEWTWGYTDEYGWVLVPPGGGGKPQPVP